MGTGKHWCASFISSHVVSYFGYVMVWGLIKVTLFELYWVGLGLAIGVVMVYKLAYILYTGTCLLVSLIEIDWRKRGLGILVSCLVVVSYLCQSLAIVFFTLEYNYCCGHCASVGNGQSRVFTLR